MRRLAAPLLLPLLLLLAPLPAAAAGPGFNELQTLALQGNAAAQYRLGRAFYEGDGVGRDLPEAADWFRMAAEQGDPDAAWYLGTMLWFGEGIPEDRIRGCAWWLAAARTNSPRALAAAGECEAELSEEEFALAKKEAEGLGRE